MAWESTSSAAFQARHDSTATEDARRVLSSLEHVRVQLEQLYDHMPESITAVLHDRLWALALSNPLIAVVRAATAPSGRELVAGWAGRDELHLLSPATFAGAPVPELAELGRLTAAALYARRVIVENNPQPGLSGRAPARLAAELRWAWLLEGGSRWLVGQSTHARAMVVRRMRGARPRFPPGLRDAPLLGPTVIELLAREEGEAAVITLTTALYGGSPEQALERAFGARRVSIEGEWRAYLSELAGRRR